jgi:hypothetical protein
LSSWRWALRARWARPDTTGTGVHAAAFGQLPSSAVEVIPSRGCCPAGLDSCSHSLPSYRSLDGSFGERRWRLLDHGGVCWRAARLVVARCNPRGAPFHRIAYELRMGFFQEKSLPACSTPTRCRFRTAWRLWVAVVESILHCLHFVYSFWAYFCCCHSTFFLVETRVDCIVWLLYQYSGVIKSLFREKPSRSLLSSILCDRIVFPLLVRMWIDICFRLRS